MGILDLRQGDCLEVLQSLDDASVDAIVTDPPYGLSFMGRKWDYDVPSKEIWEQCLRVLKPGGHLLAFAGTRTQHRMAVNIEDAGFEIRDMIAWVYGSGFPKSQNVGKAIDKTAPRRGQFDTFAKHFAERLNASGKKQKEVAALFPSKTGGLTGCVWNWANGANVPTRAQWDVLQPLLGLSDEFAVLIDRVEAEREVVGKHEAPAKSIYSQGLNELGSDVNITAPATPEAQQWDGWGTALKPALEPITVARKPFKGTVANNVLTHGTGAINIDGCRVGSDVVGWKGGAAGGNTWNSENCGLAKSGEARPVSGRWPANLIHDGSDEVTELFPQSKSTVFDNNKGKTCSFGVNNEKGLGNRTDIGGYSDSGSAARFFYCAKANKKDREDGNTHPTVKPTDLMAYLCRLVTPAGGIILDPFMGSGSTGKAAMREGFSFIGIEREAEYYAIAQQRIKPPEQPDREQLAFA